MPIGVIIVELMMGVVGEVEVRIEKVRNSTCGGVCSCTVRGESTFNARPSRSRTLGHIGGSEFCTTQDGTELSWLKAGSRSVDDTEVLQQSVGGVVESFFEGTTPLGNWLMDSSEIREELFAFRIDRHKFVLTLVALLEE